MSHELLHPFTALSQDLVPQALAKASLSFYPLLIA